MSYQVNWEIQALDQAAGFLRDDPIGVAALWDSVSQLADEPRPPESFPYGSPDLRRLRTSGAFEAAERWEWVDRNPADSARPPTVTQKKRPATPPADVVNVIDQARAAGQHDIALYVWLVASCHGHGGVRPRYRREGRGAIAAAVSTAGW